MTKAIAHPYNTVSTRAYVTGALACACLVAALVYAVSLYRMISRTVALERLDDQSTSLSGHVEALDSQYLQLSSAATMDALPAYGLSVGDISAYIPRSVSTASAASFGTLAAGGHEF